MDAALLTNRPNIVGCYMLRPFACCWMLLRVVAQSLKPVKLFSQQLPTFLLFRDRRSVAQQCWIRLHSSSNIVGATHAHYACFTKTYGLYSSHNALRVPASWELLHPFAHHCQRATMLGVVAPVCTQPEVVFLVELACENCERNLNRTVSVIMYKRITILERILCL